MEADSFRRLNPVFAFDNLRSYRLCIISRPSVHRELLLVTALCPENGRQVSDLTWPLVTFLVPSTATPCYKMVANLLFPEKSLWIYSDNLLPFSDLFMCWKWSCTARLFIWELSRCGGMQVKGVDPQYVWWHLFLLLSLECSGFSWCLSSVHRSRPVYLAEWTQLHWTTTALWWNLQLLHHEVRPR